MINEVEKWTGRIILTISKPKLPSIIRSTRSAILPMSIMEFRSLLHSIKVRRRFFPTNILVFADTTVSQDLPATTVMGPLTSDRVCFVYLFTRLLTRVVFPTWYIDKYLNF
jgi:hypothetical protein